MVESVKKLLERIRYWIDQAFARKFLGQLLLFLIMVTTVTLIGVTAMFFGLFSEANRHIHSIRREIDSGFWDSVWWSLNQVMRLQGFEQAVYLPLGEVPDRPDRTGGLLGDLGDPMQGAVEPLG